MHLIHSLLDLLFPPKCVFCRALLESGTEQVCPDCAKKTATYGVHRPIWRVF